MDVFRGQPYWPTSAIPMGRMGYLRLSMSMVVGGEQVHAPAETLLMSSSGQGSATLR